MSLALFKFIETAPSAPGTAISSQSVQGSGKAAGVAGPLDDYEAVTVIAELAGNTGGTLDVFVQASFDEGASWFDFAHFAQLAPAAAPTQYLLNASLSSNLTSPVVVGKNTTPLLAAGTCVNGAFGDRMRLVMVSGAGTTVGAAVKVSVIGQRVFPRS